MPFLEILSKDGFLDYLKGMKFTKYDPSTEKRIPHPWWNIDRAATQALLKDIADRVADSISGVTALDKELRHISTTASNLENWGRGQPIKVALIGSQGAGKSLLINALFNRPGLSLTGATGFACTSAIIRYAFGPSDKFTAEVKFLSAKLQEEMIDEHIRSYKAYVNDLEDSDNEDGPGNHTFQQEEIDRRRKKTAEDFFDTFFGSRDELLAAWSSTDDFKNLCQLRCSEAIQELNTDSREIFRVSKDTPKDLLESIKPFLANVNDRVCLWPIVDCVTIRINHELLREGIEVYDLPGSGDTNMTRTKHADAVKDEISALLLLADTNRIATNDDLVSATRAALSNIKSSMVKVIATKIDVMPEEEMDQYLTDVINQFDDVTRQTDEELAAVQQQEDDNDDLIQQIDDYKEYLLRLRTSIAIKNRAKTINTKFGPTLKDLSPDGSPVEIMHTSTANYMKWIQAARVTFNKQPPLSPQDCGVPSLRQFLYDLPASQNLRHYSDHISITVPAFVDKLQRVVTQSDRDAGFVSIANQSDDLRKRFLGDLLEQIQWHCLSYMKTSMKKIKRDSQIYKEKVRSLIENRWLSLKAASFNRVVKSRGTLREGVSKAQGLQNGVNWNAELAAIMASGFHQWYEIHSEYLRLLKEALPLPMDSLYKRTLSIIESSKANLITVEKAKQKWKPYRQRMISRIGIMADELIVEERRFLNMVTLKDERENNLIAELTDDIFDEVSVCTPPLKPTPPGKKPRYVTSMVKFRKEQLEQHLLGDETHFVDRLIKIFEEQLNEKIKSVTEKHFKELHSCLDSFSRLMVSHGPIDFEIDPKGYSIRKELEKHIPYIEDKAKQLLDLLPTDSGDEGKEQGIACEDDNGTGERPDLNYYIEKVTKEKRKLAASIPERPTKRIKRECD